MNENEVNRPSLADLERELEYYCGHYRGQEMPDLKISALYDLFPPSNEAVCEYRWPDDWPFVESPGVYFIFDGEMQLLYIGKASMNSWFGNRLHTYFQMGEDKKCVVRNLDKWNGDPRCVAVVPMDAEYRFEAPALEEYLITKLEPIDNKVGTTH